MVGKERAGRFTLRGLCVSGALAKRMEASPLRLAVTGTWRSDDEYERRTETWTPVRETALGRDGRVCRYCGRSGGPFHVHHRDGNPRNDEPPNLMTVCPLCHTCRHVGRAVSVGLGGIVETAGRRSPCLQNEFNFVLQEVWDMGGEPSLMELGWAMCNVAGLEGLRAVSADEALSAANAAARVGGAAELPVEWLFVPAGKGREWRGRE